MPIEAVHCHVTRLNELTAAKCIHDPYVACNWRAGTSQPNRSAGMIFYIIIYLFVALSLLPYVLRISK